MGDTHHVNASTAALPATRTDAVPRLRRLGVAVSAGALSGFVFGGVGGRLGMLLLRLTSDPSLRGMDTDDGFTIGVVSGETTFLLIVTTVLGAAGGVAYLLSRPLLGEHSAPWIWGALGAVVGGGAILRPDGVDFSLLEPLAVGMFIAGPALGAASTSLLTERWLGRQPRSNAWLLGLVPLVLIALAGPTTLVIVAATVTFVLFVPAAWLFAGDAVPRSVVLGGRAVLAVVGAIAALAAIRDMLEIL